MKLTWFAGTTVRIHIGGRVLVADARALPGVSEEELCSGADATIDLAGSLPAIDPVLWQPRRPGAMIDEEEALPEVLVHGLPGGVLIAAPGEAPLVLLTGNPERAGRWAHEAIVVVMGDDIARRALLAISLLAPRLIVLAARPDEIDLALPALAPHLGGTAIQGLEAAMALEV